MATPRETQDQHYREQGFYPDEDYPKEEYTAEEQQVLVDLRDWARKVVPECQSKVIQKLATAQTLYDILKVYRYHRQAVRRFSQEQIALGKSNLPTEALFNRIDSFFRLEDAIDFIIHDGGEIRIDKAYEADGETVKEGWVRFYWK